ncbi:MAG: hypothetical protein QW638_02725 [Candidatus Bathyarchaeia archaeon]
MAGSHSVPIKNPNPNLCIESQDPSINLMRIKARIMKTEDADAPVRSIIILSPLKVSLKFFILTDSNLLEKI